MKSIQTSVVIHASPAKVWTVLMDFPNYQSWNPFIQIEGIPEEGAILKNTMQLEGQKPQIFRPEVLEVQTERVFRWEGHLFFKGLFDGEHYFLLEETEEGSTRLIHGEHFRGLLVRPLLWMIGQQTKTAFEQMNQALKAECERR